MDVLNEYRKKNLKEITRLEKLKKKMNIIIIII